MIIHDADLVAIHRAHAAGGRDAAMTELRRRWLGINDTTAAAFLDRVLAMPLAVPKPEDFAAGGRLRLGSRHDGLVPNRASWRPKDR